MRQVYRDVFDGKEWQIFETEFWSGDDINNGRSVRKYIVYCEGEEDIGFDQEYSLEDAKHWLNEYKKKFVDKSCKYKLYFDAGNNIVSKNEPMRRVRTSNYEYTWEIDIFGCLQIIDWVNGKDIYIQNDCCIAQLFKDNPSEKGSLSGCYLGIYECLFADQ